MSPSRQEELAALLERVWALEPVAELHADPRLLRIHHDWLEAGEVAQRTVARLSEPLRRYLDDQAWLENRRIMGLIREIEQQAVALGDDPPEGLPFALDEPAPSIDLPVARRQLSYPVSLLLVLLRKKLAEHDALAGDPRLILSREQIARQDQR